MKKLYFVFIILFPYLANGQLDSLNNFKCSQENTLTRQSRIRSTPFPIPDSNKVIKIPVVIHVFHHGEPVGVGFNYSDEKIRKELLKINLAFAGKGDFRESIDTKIQFYLLKDSLSCNQSNIPETGINRGSLTNMSYDAKFTYQMEGINNYNFEYFVEELHNIIKKPIGTKVMNISLIPYYTQTVGLVTEGGFGNIVLRSDLFDEEENTSLVTHELGHVFGLSHTFWDSYWDDECTDGDGLEDTPPHKERFNFSPDEINECTGERVGNVIFNFMSYGNPMNNFTKMQRDWMRGTIYMYWPELIDGDPNALVSKQIKGNLATSCNFISNGNFTNQYDYDFDFKFGNLTFSNPYYSREPYLDYSCVLKTEIKEGESVYVYLDDFHSHYYYKLYIDFDNDGNFDESNEIILSDELAPFPYNRISTNITLPTSTLKNTWLRARLIRSATSSFTSCSANSTAIAFDFSIIVLPNCTQPDPPIVNNVVINEGSSTTLSASNCAGTIRWYTKGELVHTGANYTTPTLSETSHYYVTCTVSDCESESTNAKIEVKKEFTFINQISNLCVGGIQQIKFNSSPSMEYFILNFMKGNEILETKVITKDGSYLNYSIPFTYSPYTEVQPKYLQFGTDYHFKIEYFDIENLEKYTIDSPYFTIGALGPRNRLVKNPNELHNANFFNNSTYKCQGSTITLYPQVVDYSYTDTTLSALQFELYKDGNPTTIPYSDGFKITEPGTYKFKVNQAGCEVFSEENKVYNQNYILNKAIVIGDDFVCEGQEKIIYSDYNSSSAIFQWQKNGSNISGATNNSIIITESGTYNVMVEEPNCMVYPSKDVNVSFLNGLPVNISVSNGDPIVCYYDYFGVEVTDFQRRIKDNSTENGIIPNIYEYQWQKDGKNIPNVYHYSNPNNFFIDVSEPGEYVLIKKHGNCISKSNSLVISKESYLPKPKIYHQNTVEFCSTRPFVLSAPFPHLTHGEWYKDNMPTGISTYMFTVNQSGEYKFVVSQGTTCEAESDPINVSFGTSFKPIISLYDKNKSNLCGNNDRVRIDFSTNNIDFTRQWMKDGIDIPYENSFALFATQPGNYSLRVSDGICTEISNTIQVTNSNQDIHYAVSNTDLACTNAASKIEVLGVSENYSPRSYTWKRNGVTISDQTENILYTTQGGNYTVVYDNGMGCTYTSPNITINAVDSYVNALSISVPKGQSGRLSALGCNDGVVNWFDNPTQTDPIAIGSLFNTPGIDQARNYFYSCDASCVNPIRKSVFVNTESCLPNHTMKIDDLSGGVFRASNSLTSNLGLVKSTELSAGNSIELLPGFSINNGKVFKAEIKECE